MAKKKVSSSTVAADSNQDDVTLPPLVRQFKAARRASTPIVSIATPDSNATIREICTNLVDTVPKFEFDIVNGLRSINDQGQSAIDSDEDLQDVTIETQLAKVALKFPPRSVLFIRMANRFLGGEDMDSKGFIQGIYNLRDEFKSDKRTVVLIGNQMPLPPELQNDVVPLEEELPTRDQLEVTVRKQYSNASLDIEEDKIAPAVNAVVGLSSFQAEQVTAMSLTKTGLDIEALWERKRKQIEQTPGLSINREPYKFSDIGGLDVAKTYLTRYFSGKRRPAVIVFIDEIEKAMAGDGDMSGISQDQLGVTLTYMQNKGTPGLMFVGQPGGGKSVLAKAAGNEFGVPTIELDYGGMKDSLVGNSEANCRNCFKVIDSVSGGNALFIATSNGIEGLKSELKRRYKLGTYFFDYPTPEEQAPIWDVHMSRFGLTDQEKPSCVNWTGAEIENCCDQADALGVSLVEAAESIVPISISDPKSGAMRQQAANGKYLNASVRGIYRMPSAGQAKSRVAFADSERELELSSVE